MSICSILALHKSSSCSTSSARAYLPEHEPDHQILMLWSKTRAQWVTSSWQYSQVMQCSSSSVHSSSDDDFSCPGLELYSNCQLFFCLVREIGYELNLISWPSEVSCSLRSNFPQSLPKTVPDGSNNLAVAVFSVLYEYKYEFQTLIWDQLYALSILKAAARRCLWFYTAALPIA